MIYGIGVDLIEIARIEAACARFGDRFARRILTERELDRWNARRARSETRGIAYLATRFAAKEAISKALGRGASGARKAMASSMLPQRIAAA